MGCEENGFQLKQKKEGVVRKMGRKGGAFLLLTLLH